MVVLKDGAIVESGPTDDDRDAPRAALHARAARRLPVVEDATA